MADERKTLLKRLVNANGISGNEDNIAELMAEELKGIAEISRGGLGSLIAEKAGTSKKPRIMIAGHMDEIGFMVKGFTKQGYLKFSPVGGWWGHVLLGQRVLIHTRKGKDILGVIGAKAPHSLSPDERKKVMKLEDMFIDIGATEDNEIAEKSGIKTGDFVTPLSQFSEMLDKKIYLAKAWDDRIGVGGVIEILRSLEGKKHKNTVVGVGTVQEEVGLRGAKTSAYKVNPDIGFAIDVTLAQDIPGAKDNEFGEKLGKGPSISMMDRAIIPNKKLREFVIDTADELDIPYQTGVLTAGATDTGTIHLTKAGIPSLTFSVPSRYIHSHASIIHRDDFDNLVKLLTEVIVRLDEKTAKKIVY